MRKLNRPAHQTPHFCGITFSDVEPERSRLPAVLAELQPLAQHFGLSLEVVDWRICLRLTLSNPEQLILEQLPPAARDILIGILWLEFRNTTGERGSDTLASRISPVRSRNFVWPGTCRRKIPSYTSGFTGAFGKWRLRILIRAN